MKKNIAKNLLKLGLLSATFTVGAFVLTAQEEVIKPNAAQPPKEAQEALKIEREDAAKRYLIQMDYQHTLAKTKTAEAIELFTTNKYEAAIKLFRESEEIIRKKLIQDNPRPSVKVLELSSKNCKMLSECYRLWAQDLIENVDRMGEQPNPGACQKAIDCLMQAKEIYPECALIVNERIARYEEVLKGQEFSLALTPNGGLYGDKQAYEAVKARQLQVETFMKRGQVLYTQRRYEDARSNFQEVLRLDPTNIQAANWMIKLNRIFLGAVHRQWQASRNENLTAVMGAEIYPIPPREPIQQKQTVELGEKIVSPLEEKMNNILIKKIEFNNLPLEDVIDAMRQESIERDPSGVGINIISKVEKPVSESDGEATTDEEVAPADAASAAPTDAEPVAEDVQEDQASESVRPEDRPITLIINDTDATFKSVLDAIVSSYKDLRYRIDRNAVVIYSSTAKTGELQTEMFPVEEEGDEGGSLPEDEGELKRFFEDRTIIFPTGAIVKFDAKERQLYVTNTPDQIELIREILEARANPVRLINIAARFVEVAQHDLQELGMDFMLTRVPPAGASKSSIPLRFGTTSETPIQPNMISLETTSIADGTASVVTEAQPNALRSIGRNGFGSEVAPESVSDKAFSWRHTADRRVSDPLNPNVPNNWGKDWSKGVDAEIVIRALSQSSTADVLAMPSITTCEGVDANIQMVTKVYYPKEWSKPQYQDVVNNNNNNNNNNNTGNIGVNNGSLTAFVGSIPTLSEPTDIGISLTVTPSIDVNDPHTIILKTLVPKVTSFIGWRDYSFEFDLNKNGTIEEGEKQTMIMPRIEMRTVETDVYVGNGNTLMLGGSLKDKTYARVDKVPILGDLPLIGRAFQTQAKRVESTNLLIFVTARIVNTDGTPAIMKSGNDSDGSGNILDR